MPEIEQFTELVRPYNHDAMRGPTGVYREFISLRAARDAFIHALRSRGYRPTPNRTWVKAGCAAVILP